MSLFESAPDLLVSVRSAAEAEAALAGGADLIDVKEPARGPLGPADEAVIAAVVKCVAGRVPVSAACGELTAEAVSPAVPGLNYAKWGLADWKGKDWRQTLGRLLATRGPAPPQIVLAAYADWQRAAAPPLAEVVAFAQERTGSVLLVDTFDKSPTCGGRARTLLDWLSVAELTRLCAGCREAGVRVALAGSLGPEEFAALAEVGTSWLAVRGAACRGGRNGTICATQVRTLAELLRPRKLTATVSKDDAALRTPANSPST
jgi:uncharacterized protein (UPF0264 family)